MDSHHCLPWPGLAWPGLAWPGLPQVNDTSVTGMWHDSYPYSTISIYALHPMYLSLRGLRAELPEQLVQEVGHGGGAGGGQGARSPGFLADPGSKSVSQ